MPILVWDRAGTRFYESGLDRGVLYLSDGSGVPWNGLTSIVEKFDKDASSVYYDGMKISETVVLGDFSALMKAVTYPDEFVVIEGLASARRGMFFGSQHSQTFGLCYRTQIGDDLKGDTIGYKIHIIYNVTAIPHEKAYASIIGDPSLSEFEWDLTAVPVEVPGFRPTAHVILDSRLFDPWLLQELEAMLYGDVATVSNLLPMPDLLNFINTWYRVKIVDNGDGTWTATSKRDGFISINASESLFTLSQVSAIYPDDATFIISDTVDVADVPQIKILDNGDGTWTAITGNDGLILVTGDSFEIRNATADYLDPQQYRVRDTTTMD